MRTATIIAVCVVVYFLVALPVAVLIGKAIKRGSE